MQEKQTVEISTGIIFKTIIIILALWFLYLVRDIIALLFVSVLIVALIEPPVNWMQRKGIRRVVGILMIYFLLVAFIGISIFFLAPYLTEQFKELYVQIPKYSESLNNVIEGAKEYFKIQDAGRGPIPPENLGNISNSLSNLSGEIFATTVNVFSGFISIIIVFALVFYMTAKEDGIKNFIVAVVPRKHEEYATSLVVRIKNKIGKWMQGQLIVMLSIFVLNFIWLYLMGIPYAFLLALFAGIMELVPFFGPIIAAVPGVFLAFLISPVKGLIAIILYTIAQQIESQIIVPQVMKKAVGLNPIVVILSLLIGFKLGGVIGAILAIPIATGINVAIEDMMATREKPKEESI